MLRRLGFVLLTLSACAPEPLTRLRDRADAGEDVIHLPPPAADSGVPVPPPPPPVDGAIADAQAAPDASAPDAALPEDAAVPPMPECYTEPFDPAVSLSDLEQSFGGGSAFDSVLEALDRRYPGCHALLLAEQADPYTGTFTDGSSFGAAMESAMTECHEATHGWDYRHALFYEHFGYWIRADLQQELRFEVDGFPRSEIYGMIEGNGTDLYNDLYLTGEQGSRGFLELLDETNAYINGLGAIAALADSIPNGISGRDGAVAFLYYVELYLKRARTTDPGLYSTMQASRALVEHVQIQWLRAHFYLLYADLTPRVGIHDAEIRRRLYAPENMQEISLLIGRCVDASNCLCD